MVWFRLFCQTSAVSVDDFGRDLAGVQALQRKQEDVEQDMMALFQQLQVSQYPGSTFSKVPKKILGTFHILGKS